MYKVTGHTTGGWDTVRNTDSLDTAKRIAKRYKTQFDPHTGSSITIYKDSEAIMRWTGSESNRWIRVTV